MAEDKKSNIFLFYGEDNYSSYQKLKSWQTAFSQKYGENSFIETIEGKSLNPAEFTTNIEAVPFLTEKRLIIVKDFLDRGKQEDQKKVAEHLEKVSDTCILVFFETEIPDKRTILFQRLKKVGKIEYFPMLTPLQIENFIKNKAKESQINISQPVISYLAAYLGQNLWNIYNELEKLKIYASGKEVSKEMIEELVTPSLSASIFKLTDAIAAKNPKQSIKILQILIDSGEDISKIFFMIVRHFRILIQICDMVNKKENQFSITKKLKLHPFVVQNTSNQAKNFNLEKLEKIYENLLKIDIGIKTGTIKITSQDNKPFALAIEKFILECCK